MIVAPSLSDFQTVPDGALDVAALALAVATLDPVIAMSNEQLDQARTYLRDLPIRVRAHRHDLVMAGAEDDARTDLAALKHVLTDQDGFAGDADHYDDLRNANIVTVIERRRGLPIALAILYVQAGAGAGMTVRALDFPGHVVIRVERGAQMLIADPFQGCAMLDAAGLRTILKRAMGPRAELRADYYAPLSRRGMVTRLQNNIKLRLVAQGDYARAVQVLEVMRAVDPSEYRVLFDLGVLYEKLGQTDQAISYLTDYLNILPPRHPNRRDAEDLLAILRSGPNRR